MLPKKSLKEQRALRLCKKINISKDYVSSLALSLRVYLLIYQFLYLISSNFYHIDCYLHNFSAFCDSTQNNEDYSFLQDFLKA